jgi:cytochrome c5
MRGVWVSLVVLGAGVIGCDGGHSGAAPVGAGEGVYREFAQPRLRQGRTVWIGTCKACHAAGVAGAPVAGDWAEWEKRIAQGRAVLYEHAINGFYGPDYTFMPPRGGNAGLTDDEVGSAVDYMAALASD